MSKDKYTVETGLNSEGIPVLKCSPDFYNELISEIRELLKIIGPDRRDFLRAFPAIGLIATMPTMSESQNGKFKIDAD